MHSHGVVVVETVNFDVIEPQVMVGINTCFTKRFQVKSSTVSAKLLEGRLEGAAI